MNEPTKNSTDVCRTDLISVSLVTHPVAHNEENDKREHRSHDDPANNDHDGAAKKLGLHEMAPQVLRLRGEVDAANHPGGGQRCHLVVIDGQNTQVIRGARRQIVHQDALAARGDHSVTEKKIGCEV